LARFTKILAATQDKRNLGLFVNRDPENKALHKIWSSTNSDNN